MPLTEHERSLCEPWLRLSLTPAIGPATLRRLLAAFGLPEAVLAAGQARLSAMVGATQAQALLGSDPARDDCVEAALDWAASDPRRHLVTFEDPRYPPHLLQISDPPGVLYVHGNADLLGRDSIAIVGSRHASRQGLSTAGAFSEALAARGLLIVSGLARGIDAAAHEGALRSGTTVAVLGTGIDRIYPRAHQTLAERIVEQGALVSELPLNAPALRANFPRRNRLIAGLSQATLVVEAARHSGSLITARLAAEAGREVMAIPGSIHSPLAKGCHRLIRDGAKLVDSIDDVLVELRGVSVLTASALSARAAPTRERRARPVSPESAGQIARLMGFDPVDVDTLVDRSGMLAGELGSLLLRMELDGMVERLPDGRFQRCA